MACLYVSEMEQTHLKIKANGDAVTFSLNNVQSSHVLQRIFIWSSYSGNQRHGKWVKSFNASDYDASPKLLPQTKNYFFPVTVVCVLFHPLIIFFVRFLPYICSLIFAVIITNFCFVWNGCLTIVWTPTHLINNIVTLLNFPISCPVASDA